MQTQLVFYICLVFLISSCSEKAKEQSDSHTGHNNTFQMHESGEVIYRCPMDTQIVRNAPGACPICGMDLKLEPRKNAGGKHKGVMVYKPVNVTVLSTVKSIRPEIKAIPYKLKVNGYVSYDERRIYSISARIAGRIEKLYVKYKYQPIKKNQAVFQIYSHELQTAHQEYLFVKTSDPGNSTLINAARKKLELLGVTESQIKQIVSSEHVHATTTVFSSYDGFVIERKNEKEKISTTPSLDNMGASTEMEDNNQEISVREGAYVGKGETVFQIANTDAVWAVFELYSQDLANIKLGQAVHISLEHSSDTISGKIDFIEPVYKESAGTTRVRVYLKNKEHNLKIGTLLSGQIELGEKKGLFVPTSSVYDLGEDKIVFVKTGDVFQTRKVHVGNLSDREVEILTGLVVNEEIAENAQFMVDSESFIKVSK